MGHCDDVHMDTGNREWFCVTVEKYGTLYRKDEKHGRKDK